MVFRSLLTFLAFCLVGFSLKADEIFQSEKFFENIQVTELILKNGIHVYLRPSENEEQEVMLQIAAPGGYTSFPNDEQATARLVADVVWESGFGSLSSDQLSALLYNYSIELDIAVKPFYHTILGECSTESLPMLIKLISDFLARPQFHKSGLDAALKMMNEIIEHSNFDKTQKYENAFFLLNTKAQPKNALLTKESMNEINLKKLPFVFESLFTPQDFCCVITGDFDIDLIKPYIAKFLGDIPKKNKGLKVTISPQPIFPSHPESQVIALKNGSDSLTRITFPIAKPIDSSNIYKLEMVCQTIEAHLRSIMQRRLKSSYGVDVAYEFPFYPSFIFPWITIQYRSDFSQAEDLAKIITSEIQHLKNKGPSLADLQAAELSQKANDEFWYNDDEYWLSFLTNAHLMGLTPSSIFELQKNEKTIALEKMNEILSSLIDAARYTQLTTKPE